MSVKNIILFHSVLAEALERLGKKNLKLKECQYEAVKAVVVDRKDTICILPIGHGKSLIYQLLPFCGLLNIFICNACAVRATYSFLYIDHGLSQSLRFLPKGSQARGTRLLYMLESQSLQVLKLLNVVTSNFIGVTTLGSVDYKHYIEDVKIVMR